MNTNINIDTLKLYLVPLVAFVFVVVASLTAGTRLSDSLVSVRAQIGQEDLQSKELTGKRDFLAGLAESDLKAQTAAGVAAIPGEDSLLTVLSTLRTLGLQKGVNVLDFQVKSAGETGSLNSVGVVLNIQGSLDSVTSYVEAIKGYAPRMIIVAESINISGTLSAASLEIVSAWSPLPASVGSISSRLEPISASDLELLQTLQNLNQIEQTTTPVAPASGRQNPFVF